MYADVSRSFCPNIPFHRDSHQSFPLLSTVETSRRYHWKLSTLSNPNNV
jgi:hypothetical protein